MFAEVEMGVVQHIGCDIQAVDAREHAAEHHHLGVFGMGQV